MTEFSTYFPNFESLPVKIGGKTVNALIMADLETISDKSKFIICINQSEIDFEQNKDQGLGIIPTTPATIKQIDYEVLSGRLINDNPSINPFYQLELIKL